MNTVLLVDDHELQLNAWARDFARAGKATLKATTGEEALELAREGHPDVAIVDMFLVNETGVDVTRALKKLDPNLFIVVVSADMTVAYTMAAVRAGADDVFVKPIKCAQVVKRVEDNVPLEPDWDDDSTKLTLDQVEWEHICRALLENKRNVTHAAEELGIHRQTLQRKLRKRGRSR